MYTRETVEENSGWVIERKRLERSLELCEIKIGHPASKYVVHASLQLWNSFHPRLDQTMASTGMWNLIQNVCGREGRCTYAFHDPSHLGHDDLSPRDNGVADTIRTEKSLKRWTQTVFEGEIRVRDGMGSVGIRVDAIKQVEFECGD